MNGVYFAISEWEKRNIWRRHSENNPAAPESHASHRDAAPSTRLPGASRRRAGSLEFRARNPPDATLRARAPSASRKAWRLLTQPRFSFRIFARFARNSRQIRVFPHYPGLRFIFNFF
ncbi:hypothetical protein [Paraburkholderia pallida]|uniref:Uncharacterized protein n=1 Tax=Paraburkholderia pallida TaxID=2547399 RepID=A0A4P7CZM4_9BURK|nr:hypothetical protein [Paraburkholderia pallida]QBR01819.1 hypothetical protein E1956_32260 [Paraburkholderia pallida]